MGIPWDQYDQETYIPEKNLVPKGEVEIKPHIYSEEETCRLIRLAKQLTPPNSLRPHTYATLIGLLWLTGLRIGETIRLNIVDVDLEIGLLHIQKSKFFKSRLVPLSKSSTLALAFYRKRCDSYGHNTNDTAPFFVNERAKRCTDRTVDDTFRVLTEKADIKTLQVRNT